MNKIACRHRSFHTSIDVSKNKEMMHNNNNIQKQSMFVPVLDNINSNNYNEEWSHGADGKELSQVRM